VTAGRPGRLARPGARFYARGVSGEATAEERERIVRRAFEAFAARDLEALTELVAPEIELRPLVSVWQRSYRGLDGLEEWFGEVNRTWDEFTFEAEDVRELDPERMLVKARWRGRAVAGGSEMGGPSAALVAFRGDKVVLADFYVNEEAALGALGSARG
jgi:ketosteroid isomerase-like protein